jgi:uncharacterized repeat protein (TIGR01451 family)
MPPLPPCFLRAHPALLLSSALALASVPGSGLSAQDLPPATEGGAIRGLPWSGAPGITESVATILARQQVRDRLVGPPHILEKPELELPEKDEVDPGSAAVSKWPIEDVSAANVPGPRLPQAIGVNFLGISGSIAGLGESTAIPPDSMGGVGPTQVVVASNGRLKVFDKSGVLGPLNVEDETFWASVSNGDFVTDPRVRYDRLSTRWFLTIINVPTDILGNPQGPNRILIAVSSGPTITSGSSFTFFQFQQDLPTPAGDTNGFADYDTLGVDRFALYIGANIFTQDTSTFLGSSVWVVNKANLIAGTLTVSAFRQVATAAGAGCTTPQGATNDDPAATEGYFIGVDGTTAGRLVLRRVSTPGGTPSISGNLNLPVPTTRAPIGVVARDVPSAPLDGLDDRLFVAHVRRNKLTGTSSLWTAHGIEVGATGVAAAGGRNGSRWYEIGTLAGTPTLLQAGTLFDSATTNPRSYWIPSVNMSGQGHMALGTTHASVNDYAGVAVAGRLAGDPAGATAAPTIAQPGLAAYDDIITAFLGLPAQRWGDYSQTLVDPNDDMTFWTFQEYSDAGDFGGWGVRATQLRAPPPATPSSAVPSTVAPGQAAVSVTVTGVPLSGSGFFDPGPDTGGPGFANHIAASVSGSVTVNSVSFTSPSQVMLSLNTTAATAGSKTVSIINPDGQIASGAILTISGVAPPGAILSGTKTVAGTFLPTGAVTYTVTLTNTGTGTQANNPGNELTDVLPASLTLVSASASSGTATATVGTNTVTWNGSLAVAATVTLTIQATIKPTVTGGTTVSNQGSISYDSDGNGTNDASTQTDDPSVAGTSNPTVLTVKSAYFTATPCRVVDTRGTPNGPLAGPALVAGASRSFALAPHCGIPPTASAVSLNVTVTQPTGAGDLRLYPAGSSLPLVSTINWVAGQTRANNAVAVLSPTGLAVQCDQVSGSVHLILDVNGYFE